MTYRSEIGQLGEDLACKYLVDKAYRIIERNFRRPWGELDIIAEAPDKTLVFIEVKTMRENPGGLEPADQLTKSKLQKLKRTASLYAGHYPGLIKDDKGWRIDLITLVFQKFHELILNKPSNLTINEKSCDIKYYENIAD